MFIHTYTQPRDGRDPDINWLVAAFETPRENRPEITSWCYKTFGPPGINHLTQQVRWKDSIRYGEVYFLNQEDRLMFILRWS